MNLNNGDGGSCANDSNELPPANIAEEVNNEPTHDSETKRTNIDDKPQVINTAASNEDILHDHVVLSTYESYLVPRDIKHLMLGMGWNLGRDVDVSVVLLDEHFAVVDKVWHQQMKSKDGSVLHSGDNLSGDGDGDDETVTVDLNCIPLHVHHIALVGCLFAEQRQDGPEIPPVMNLRVRISGVCGKERRVLCGFDLKKIDSSSVLGQLTRRRGRWMFRALNAAATGNLITKLIRKPENLHCLHDFVSEAPGFRQIVVYVVSGSNLAASAGTGWLKSAPSADPYYCIQYKSRRYTSQSCRNSLNPNWAPTPFDLGKVIDNDTTQLVLTVFDRNILTTDRFMGVIRIPVWKLYDLGVGEHRQSFQLQESDDKELAFETVAGTLCIEFHISDTQPPSASFS